MIKSIDYLKLHFNDVKLNLIPSKKQKETIRNREQFYASFVNAGDLCFDVGANAGNRISPLLAAGAEVVAIEPQESCYRFLNFKFGGRITIVNKGLGEFETVKDFHISSSNKLSSFSTEWIDSVKKNRFQNYSWDKPLKMEMSTLDNLIKNHGHPAFIKIDVEGYELEVLKGLTKPVNIISFEDTVPEQTGKVIDCIEQIEKNHPNIECNYSIGEGMIFAKQIWMTVDKMKNHVVSEAFIATDFGDVYVRIKR
jgi:FkbM family methyltransferase